MRRLACSLILAALLALPLPAVADTGEFLREAGEWMGAWALMMASHEYGHQRAADSQGVPIEWSFLGKGGPHWNQDLTVIQVGYPTIPGGGEFPLQKSFTVNTAGLTDVQVATVADKQLLGFIKTFNGPVTITTTSKMKEGVKSYTMTCASQNCIKVAKNYDAWAKQNQLMLDAERKTQELRTRAHLVIAGGGIRGQQLTAELLPDGKFRRKYLVMSALNKFSYAAFPHSLQPGTAVGDVASFKQVHAQPVMQAALALSGVADIYRAYAGKESGWSLDVWQSDFGTPGLQLVMKW